MKTSHIFEYFDRFYLLFYFHSKKPVGYKIIVNTFIITFFCFGFTLVARLVGWLVTLFLYVRSRRCLYLDSSLTTDGLGFPFLSCAVGSLVGLMLVGKIGLKATCINASKKQEVVLNLTM